MTGESYYVPAITIKMELRVADPQAARVSHLTLNSISFVGTLQRANLQANVSQRTASVSTTQYQTRV